MSNQETTKSSIKFSLTDGQLSPDVELLDKGYFTMSLVQIARYLSASTRVAQDFCSHSEVSSCRLGINCLNEDICRRAEIPKTSSSRNFNLYRNDEVFARLRATLRSEAVTVRFPMSYFSDDPAAFRRQFIKDRLKEWETRNTAGKLLRSWVSTHMLKWESMRRLTAYGIDQLFAFGKDAVELAEVAGKKTAVLDCVFPTVPVQIPDCFPFFESVGVFGNSGIMDTPAASIRTAYRWIRRTGAVQHYLDFKGDYQSSQERHLVRYTDGLLLGKEIHWPDYLIGATTLMTAVRAKQILGEDFGKRWQFTRDNVRTLNDLPFSDWRIGAASRLQREEPNWYRTEFNIRKLNFYV